MYFKVVSGIPYWITDALRDNKISRRVIYKLLHKVNMFYISLINIIFKNSQENTQILFTSQYDGQDRTLTLGYKLKAWHF